MIFIIKSCIRGRLATEKLKQLQSDGKKLTFFMATVLTTMIVMGLFMLLAMAFDDLRPLATRKVMLIVFSIESTISIILSKRGFYEKTRDYFDSLDETTLKLIRKRNAIIVFSAISVYVLAAIVALIRATLI